MTASGDFLAFARDFVSFGRLRLVVAIALMVAGTLVEGIGILLLVPALIGVFGTSGGSAVAPLATLPGGGSLPLLLIIFAVAVALRSVIVLARERMAIRLQVAFVEDARLRLVERLTKAAWVDVADVSHGRIIQALSVEIHQVGIAVNSLMAAASSAVILLATALLAMAVLPAAAVAAFAIAGLSYLPLRRILARTRHLGESITERHFGMTEDAIAFLNSLKAVAAEGTGPAWLRQQRQLSAAAIDDRVAFALLHARAKELSLAMTAIAAIALVGGGIAAGFPAPGLLALLLMLSRMTGPAVQVQRGVQQLVHSLPAYRRLCELDALLQPAATSLPLAAAPSEAVALSFQRVSLARKGHDIFRDFSIDIPAGAMVGVSGPSGVGKTTLLDLMAGVLRPDAGAIWRSSPAARDFASHIAYVDQSTMLTGRTLRAILCWSSDASATEMTAVLGIVGADALLERVGGLDAPLGERGALISGGERQRIGLARALLRRPELLLLDEALNALDQDAERDLLTRLAGLEPRPTIVLVAHRPEAFLACDRIIRLSRLRAPVIEDRSPARTGRRTSE